MSTFFLDGLLPDSKHNLESFSTSTPVYHATLMSETHSSTHSFFSTTQLSDEQRNVVKAVVNDRCNVIVNAVAGSGKTRTSLVTAMEWVSDRLATSEVTGFSQFKSADQVSKCMVLLVVYNRGLKEDTVAQLQTRVPENLHEYIEVRTIHSLGYHYFGGSGLTKEGALRKWTITKAKPTKAFPPFSLVIIDEAQDLTLIMFEFLHYVMSLLNPKRPQLLILGDPFQLLYGFNGADDDFLINANDKFKDVVANARFKRFKLSVCFRITKEMAGWINDNLNPNKLDRACARPTWNFENYREQIRDWWGSGIKADKSRPSAPDSVKFYRKDELASTYKDQIGKIVDKVKDVLQQYGTNSFALLGTSFKSDYSPARTIINRLDNVAGVAQSWYNDWGDDVHDYRDPALRANKLISSTVHRFKGRECDVIALIGFDAFCERQGRNDPIGTYNLFYVAATRARKCLLIVQWGEPYATQRERIHSHSQEPLQRHSIHVTRALTHCSYDPILEEESDSCLSVKTVLQGNRYHLSKDEFIVPGFHRPTGTNTKENVARVIAHAVEIRFQLILDNNKLIVPSVPEHNERNDDPIDNRLRQYLLTLREQALSRAESSTRKEYSWTELMKIATAFLAFRENNMWLWRQTRNFSQWNITKSRKLDDIVNNLIRLVFVPFGVEESTGMWNIGLTAGPNNGVENLSSNDFFNRRLHVKEAKEVEKWKRALIKLRREGRIIFHSRLWFNMGNVGANTDPMALYPPNLHGTADIALISKQTLKKLEKENTHRTAVSAAIEIMNSHNKSSEVEGALKIIQTAKMTNAVYDAVNNMKTEKWATDYAAVSNLVCQSDDGTGITIINLSMAPEESHDHVLETGCYGAMWRETRLATMRSIPQNPTGLLLMSNEDIAGHVLGAASTGTVIQHLLASEVASTKMPEILLLYPSLGRLVQVQLGMNSKEFLHRVGFRKINLPFNPAGL